MLKICSLLLFISAVYCHEIRSKFRLLNGKKDAIENIPYFAQIYSTNGFGVSCGGAILSEQWILTSAYCANDIPEFYRIVVGYGLKYRGDPWQWDRETPPPEWHGAEFARRPVKYRKSKNPDDKVLYEIGFIKLEKPLVFSDKIKPIKIRSKPLGKELLKVSGVGFTPVKSARDHNDDVKSISIPVVDNKLCNEMYFNRDRKHQNFTNDIFCAGTEKAVLCNEDAGDPAVDNHGELVGIGVGADKRGCIEGALPSIFTNVTYYLDWIKKSMENPIRWEFEDGNDND